MYYVKLKDVLDTIRNNNWNLVGLINHIKEHCPVTINVAEVTRCKDCDAYGKYVHCEHMGPFGFCSMGFKKEAEFAVVEKQEVEHK